MFALLLCALHTPSNVLLISCMVSPPHNHNIMVFCGCVGHVMDVWGLTMHDIIVNSHYYILKVCMATEAY